MEVFQEVLHLLNVQKQSEIVLTTDEPQLNEDCRSTIKTEETIKSCPKLFICDIISATNYGNFLKFGNIEFSYAAIRGLVIDLFISDRKTILKVDDDTGVIFCFVEPNVELEKYRELLINSHERKKIDDSVNDSIKIMKNSIRSKMRMLPNFKAFRFGDTVQIVGKFKEFRGCKYCFVDFIMKEIYFGTDMPFNYFTRMKYLYENVYKL